VLDTKQQPRETQSPQAKSALRILVVEDHADTARIMELLLGRHGYEVQIASTVQDALKLADAGSFDLLISDVRLPDGDGFELLGKIRQTQPVIGICLSGNSSDEDKSRSRAAGFVEYLTKPVRMDDLIKAIDRAKGVQR
jgi:two-component system CheB/CheR fusion protein